MSNKRHTKTSPRQRMINLMYLVFIALLALNVSTDTADVFELLDTGMNRILQELEKENREVYITLEEKCTGNPEWKEKELGLYALKEKTDSLCNYIHSLKHEMMDMNKGKYNKEEAESVARVMFAPIKGEGVRLRKKLAGYNEFIRENLKSAHEKDLFIEAIHLLPLDNKGLTIQNWETTLFESRPLYAVLPLLTNIEFVIRWSENCVLRNVCEELSPETLSGETTYDYPSPSVSISSLQTRVLYAGYPNELEIAVAGIPAKQLEVKINNGTISLQKENRWAAVPEIPGEETFITVSYVYNERKRVDSIPFRVLKMPDPALFFRCTDEIGTHLYSPEEMTRQRLIACESLEVLYEDQRLEAAFSILSFELNWLDSFGNRLSEKASGNQITNRQKEIIRNLLSGKICWFSKVEVIGEDKLLRILPPLEIIID